ncbi:MAG: hypothetical protein K2J20_06875 [Bacilli bacterium]|nr:hypothetical protein [Bacilli bacterium]
MFRIAERIDNCKKYNDVKYTKKEISEDIKKVMEELKPIQVKYDYSKLPRIK